MIFFRNSVRSAVVKVINTRIREAEKHYQFGLSQITAETKAKMKAVRNESLIRQKDLLDECVNEVIG